MHPLLELKTMLLRGVSITGVVDSVAGTTALVRTRLGTKSLDIPSGLTLVSGDRVRIESNTITGKLRPESEVPVLRV